MIFLHSYIYRENKLIQFLAFAVHKLPNNAIFLFRNTLVYHANVSYSAKTREHVATIYFKMLHLPLEEDEKLP